MAAPSPPYRLPTERRAVFQVGPLTISRRTPSSLMRTGQQQRSHETLGAPSPRHPPFPNGRTRDLEGPTSGEAPQGGIAFHTLREYVTGDDLRLIHWKSSAKTGDLMVRHNVDTYQPRSLVVLDVHDKVAWTPSSRGAGIGSLMVASIRNNFVRLRTTGGLVIGSEGGGRLERILDQLAGLTPEPNASLASMSRQVSAERGGYLLAVVTGQATAATWRWWGRCGALPEHHDRPSRRAGPRLGTSCPVPSSSTPPPAPSSHRRGAGGCAGEAAAAGRAIAVATLSAVGAVGFHRILSGAFLVRCLPRWYRWRCRPWPTGRAGA